MSVEVVVQDLGEKTLARDLGKIFSILMPCWSGVWGASENWKSGHSMLSPLQKKF